MKSRLKKEQSGYRIERQTEERNSQIIGMKGRLKKEQPGNRDEMLTEEETVRLQE